MVPAPTTVHQRVSRRLEHLLDLHVTAQSLGEMFYSPIDVIFGVGDQREVAQPDIVYISAARSDIIKLHGIEGAPDLVVEILSASTEARDRGYKRALYLREGVLEYWIVNPDARTLEVHTSEADPRVFAAGEVLHSPLFPGLDISLADFLG
jgi:Uma2 family endonuclease